jgi:hypothetical protein
MRFQGFGLCASLLFPSLAFLSRPTLIAEPKRIVAWVEALLRQCDALAAQLHQTRTLGTHLLDSTLHHLLTA